MSFWKEQLKQRIPEYHLTDSELTEYLEVCGETFDEISDEIKNIDFYKDYKKTAQSRLSLLAARFNFNPPADIDETLMRGIMRDIVFINKTNGTMDAIKWVFKLLNWDVEYKLAWLPDPERYFPVLEDLFPNTFSGKSNEPVYDETETVQLQIGQPYKIGVENQTYHVDPEGTIPGYLKIGENEVGYTYIADNGIGGVVNQSTDVGAITVNTFLYGDPVVRNNGVYMYGNSLFGDAGDARDFRILGESYDNGDVNRTENIVLSTPYILVLIEEQQYLDIFNESYGSGDFTSLTDILLQYLLHQYVRPANVKILSLSGGFSETDIIEVNETLDHVVTDLPLLLTEDGGFYINTEDDFALLLEDCGDNEQASQQAS